MAYNWLALTTMVSVAIGSSAFAYDSSGSRCEREYRSNMGYVHSFESPFFQSSSTLCDVYVSPASQSGYAYDFQAGGLMNITDKSSNKIHTYQFITPSFGETQYRRDNGELVVSQRSMDWKFSEKDFALKSVTQHSTGRNCVGGFGGKTTVSIASGETLDLEACSDVLAIDLGSSSTRETAVLKTKNKATVSGFIAGEIRTCKVKIGDLFDYKEGTRPQLKPSSSGSAQNVILDKNLDPCMRYFSTDKEVAALPFGEQGKAFRARNPNHECVTGFRMASAAEKTTLTQKVYRSIPASRVSADLDISASAKSPAELRSAIMRGEGKDCRALALKINDGSAVGGDATGAGSNRSTR